MAKVQVSKDGTVRVAIPRLIAKTQGFTQSVEVEVKSDDRCGGVNVRRPFKNDKPKPKTED